MLLFKADFETAFEEQLSNEIIILICYSNSMAGSALHQAEPIALHVLDFFFRERMNIVRFSTDEFLYFFFTPEPAVTFFTWLNFTHIVAIKPAKHTEP